MKYSDSMNSFYLEEVSEYFGRSKSGVLIEASNITSAKKMASKLKKSPTSILSLYKVTDRTEKSCKRIAVLADGYWRNIDSNIKYIGVWNEAKIKSKAKA